MMRLSGVLLLCGLLFAIVGLMARLAAMAWPSAGTTKEAPLPTLPVKCRWGILSPDGKMTMSAWTSGPNCKEICQ